MSYNYKVNYIQCILLDFHAYVETFCPLSSYNIQSSSSLMLHKAQKTPAILDKLKRDCKTNCARTFELVQCNN